MIGSLRFYQISPAGDKSHRYPADTAGYPTNGNHWLCNFQSMQAESKSSDGQIPSFCDIFPPSAPRYTWIEHQIGWHRVRQNDAPVRGIQTGTGGLPKCGGVVDLTIFGFKTWSLTSTQFKEDGISSNKQTVTINNNLVLNH